MGVGQVFARTAGLCWVMFSMSATATAADQNAPGRHDVRGTTSSTLLSHLAEDGPPACQDIFTWGLAYGFNIMPSLVIEGLLDYVRAVNLSCHDAGGSLVNAQLRSAATGLRLRFRPLHAISGWNYEDARHGLTANVAAAAYWQVLPYTQPICTREEFGCGEVVGYRKVSPRYLSTFIDITVGYEFRGTHLSLLAIAGILAELGKDGGFYPLVRLEIGMIL